MPHAGAPSTEPVCVIRTSFAFTGANAIDTDGPVPCPSAPGSLHVVPSSDTCTLYPRAYGCGRGGAPGGPNGPADWNCSSVSITGSGSSNWNHIPGCCGTSVDQPAVPNARTARSDSCDAVALH